MSAMVGSGVHTFQVIEDWARLPSGWSAKMAAVAVDSEDRVYGFNRGDHPVIVFDKNGEYLYSWGEGRFAFPHSIRFDAEGNVWIVDCIHSQIYKFTTRGELLLAIGTKGFYSDSGAKASGDIHVWHAVTRAGGPFNLPTDIVVAESGDLFITDGYGNCQVHRFSPDGKHLYSWGQPGSGPGQFVLPHGIWIDSQGRVLVADRENDRVQVFAQSGEFIAQWPAKLVGPATFWVDRNDIVYVPEHNGGFFSVLTLEGEVLARWGSEQYKSCHSVAGDSDGNLYFVQHAAGKRDQGRRIVKYLRQG